MGLSRGHTFLPITRKWGVAFGDDKLASALIDRIMHHGRLVELNGTSKRMEHALMLGKAAG